MLPIDNNINRYLRIVKLSLRLLPYKYSSSQHEKLKRAKSLFIEYTLSEGHAVKANSREACPYSFFSSKKHKQTLTKEHVRWQ